MTQLNTAIRFNSSTGSDTAASGVGPATAVTGNGASTTASSAVVTGISTTGVTAGDLLYVQSSSGRQFSVIASVDSGTQVTCDDTFTNTESGRAWAIGGKRATLQNSQYLWIKDYGIGRDVVYELETDQAMTSYVGSYSDMGGTIKSSVAGTKRTIEIGGSYFVSGGSWTCHDIHFTSSANSRLGSATTSSQNSGWNLTDCIVGDATDHLQSLGFQSARTFSVVAQRTTFQNFSSHIANQIQFTARDCLIKDSPRVWYSASLTHHIANLFRCVVRDCTEIGYMRRGSNVVLVGNIFYNTGGFHYQDNGTTNVRENIFVNMTSEIESYTTANANFYRNAHYNSTGIWPPPDDSDPITLTADPFVDAANGDFNLNADAGGGAVLRSNNYTVGG